MMIGSSKDSMMTMSLTRMKIAKTWRERTIIDDSVETRVLVTWAMAILVRSVSQLMTTCIKLEINRTARAGTV